MITEELISELAPSIISLVTLIFTYFRTRSISKAIKAGKKVKEDIKDVTDETNVEI